MVFVHEDPDFDDLLRIVGDQRRLSVGLVEKDYWVTHTLWALLDQGFELWFKGGTSLSKGFGIIQRFSEDLDVRVHPGTVAALPAVANWMSQGRPAVAQRRAHFEQLASTLRVPGADVSLDEAFSDSLWRNAAIRVTYPGGAPGGLGLDASFRSAGGGQRARNPVRGTRPLVVRP